MRFANHADRFVLITKDGAAVDVLDGSGGVLPSDPTAALDRWTEVLEWAATSGDPGKPVENCDLAALIPRPRQVFGIGLNYASHAAESNVARPDFPPTFTKFPTSLTGPVAEVQLPSDHVDWEAELVVVIGHRAHRVGREDAWAHVAGVTVGQDLSDRAVQLRPPVPQFSLGKSFPGFSPIGPYLVTPDELSDRDDLEIRCTLNGEIVQLGRTSNMIFDVPALVECLSSIVTLLPGDLIFTGTPAGVGASRTPPRFLNPGDQLITAIEGVGELRTRLTATRDMAVV